MFLPSCLIQCKPYTDTQTNKNNSFVWTEIQADSTKSLTYLLRRIGIEAFCPTRTNKTILKSNKYNKSIKSARKPIRTYVFAFVPIILPPSMQAIIYEHYTDTQTNKNNSFVWTKYKRKYETLFTC